MRAGTITLRIGSKLVGLRADTATTMQRARGLLAAWIDDDCGEVPWAFDLMLDPAASADQAGPRPVPQLRFGQSLLASSRSADDVLIALANVLGGLHARDDESMLWFRLRVLASDTSAVLVEAPPMTFSGDRTMERAGISELATWMVAVTGGAAPMVRVPPPLIDLDWVAAGLEPSDRPWATLDLAGVVALHEPPTSPNDTTGVPEELRAAELLAYFGRRHSDRGWFPIAQALSQDGRLARVRTRPALRSTAIQMIGASPSASLSG